MLQKRHYEQLGFKIVVFRAEDIVRASVTDETNDGKIFDSVWTR